MGEAIFAGLLRHKLARPADIRIVEASQARSDEMRSKYRIGVVDDANALVAQCDVIVLAVKPQDLETILPTLDRTIIGKRLFISIAAGKTLDWLEERLPGARVIRTMPNLAMRVGAGMSAFCLGTRAKVADRRLTQRILSCSGIARELPEELFDAVTALSGSGPAFMAVILQAFVDAGTELGLPPQDALALARQTMLGTAKVLDEGDESLADFVKSVTSAKGTTAAGLDILQKSSLPGIITRTLKAAARRSRELSR